MGDERRVGDVAETYGECERGRILWVVPLGDEPGESCAGDEQTEATGRVTPPGHEARCDQRPTREEECKRPWRRYARERVPRITSDEVETEDAHAQRDQADDGKRRSTSHVTILARWPVRPNQGLP